jgi:hypothetical protein
LKRLRIVDVDAEVFSAASWKAVFESLPLETRRDCRRRPRSTTPCSYARSAHRIRAHLFQERRADRVIWHLEKRVSQGPQEDRTVVARISQTIINSAKVEIQYLEVVGEDYRSDLFSESKQIATDERRRRALPAPAVVPVKVKAQNGDVQ